LLHVVDISGAEGRDPYEDFVKLNAELSSYSAVLAKLPMAVAANKCETAEAEQNLVRFKKKVKNVEVFAISALQRKGLSELLKYLTAELMKLPKARRLEYEQFNYPEADIDGVKIEKIADDVFAVAGGFIDNLLRRINFSDSDSFIYFQKLLKDREIFKQLRELGAKEGDTVVVGDMEFDFVD
jgi:GTP-binding protein